VYPGANLGPANVLLMPALNSAAIAAKLLQQLGGGTVIEPVLLCLSHSAQIVQTGATVFRDRHRRGIGRARREGLSAYAIR
jgi:malate dehydrogenase (oxaloacetate-decarboxylating)(NADP+)